MRAVVILPLDAIHNRAIVGGNKEIDMPRDYTILHSAECERCGAHVPDDETLDGDGRCLRCQDELEQEAEDCTDEFDDVRNNIEDLLYEEMLVKGCDQ